MYIVYDEEKRNASKQPPSPVRKRAPPLLPHPTYQQGGRSMASPRAARTISGSVGGQAASRVSQPAALWAPESQPSRQHSSLLALHFTSSSQPFADPYAANCINSRLASAASTALPLRSVRLPAACCLRLPHCLPYPK